jgi:RNA-directed DNA polymerase
LATRKVTQDNTGKKTAGVDKVKSLTPNQRLQTAFSLGIPTKASPLRRVWIPKPGKTEYRPLGIPTIKDRCLQALLKLAIEPEWEAKFEPNSYGFRPGRSAHDAIAACRNAIMKRSKYVLEADIKKCFDRINHDYLLKKIGMKGHWRKQIKMWLMAGVLDGDVLSKTTLGTPQGGVISPLLANIALHGLEDYLKEAIRTRNLFPLYSASGQKIRKSRLPDTVHLIRYADDFVVLHHDLTWIRWMKELIIEFLTPIGLELSEAKTSFGFTLSPRPENDEATEYWKYANDPYSMHAQSGNYFMGTNSCSFTLYNKEAGFNFLGFTMVQKRTIHRSFKDPGGNILGYKTLVYPSKKSINKYQEKLHNIVLQQGKQLDQVALIKKLNPIIRGWSNYFGKSDAATMGFLNKQDYLLYLKLRKWAKRVTGNSNRGANFWHRIGSRKWVYCTTDLKVALLSHNDYSCPFGPGGYIKVREEGSPFDGKDIYWTNRLSSNPIYPTRVQNLLKKQKGFCTWCKLRFMENDVLEVDHIIPRIYGGKDTYDNLQLLHRHCHDSKTTLDKMYSIKP